MRAPISTLENRKFDVAVVGAGVNGSSAAQHLAAAGYTVLLVDKSDFGSGSSSRSTRMMHCGLRYLAPGRSMWEFAGHPRRLRTALRMARQAMESRAQFVETTTERAVPVKWFYPIYEGGPYSQWQVDLAFSTLKALGPRSVPLDYERLPANDALRLPLLRWVRDSSRLSGAGVYREYLYEWPERICVDAVLDARRLDAAVRNYTEVVALQQTNDGWSLSLRDTIPPHKTATATAKVVLNTAGIWIDQVNGRNASDQKPGRKITGTKGVHIMFELPPECGAHGMTMINRQNEPINFTPWRGMRRRHR